MSQNRRLAAIMVGDLVGFTAEMAIDEAHALSYVRRMRAVAEPLVRRWEGRLIKHIGDGFLVAFDSAVEAVDCAVAIQRELAAEPDFKLRLGVHLGDVLFGDDDVFGDGVNVAARLEMLAQPGGICVSQNVWELVRNQTGVVGTLIGETTIPPGGIEAWSVAGEGMPAPTGHSGGSVPADGLAHKVTIAGGVDRLGKARRAAPLVAAAAVGAVLALAGAGGLWRLLDGGPGAGARRGWQVLVVDVGSNEPGGGSPGAEPPGSVLATQLNQLLADELGSLRGVRVVPRDQVRDGLLLLREPADARVGPELARRVALRDGAVDAVVQGAVSAIGGGFVLTVEVVDPRTSQVLLSVQRDADGEGALLPAMRRLLEAVGTELPAALASLPERTEPEGLAWSRVTTDDDAALADYRAAYRATLDGDWRAALALAERAVDADAAFAMGHLLAAEATRALGRDIDGGKSLDRATTLVDALQRPIERELVQAGLLRARGSCRDAAASLGVVADDAPETYRAYSHWTLTSRAGALACGGRVRDALAELEALAAAAPADPLPLSAALDVHLRFAGDIAGARQAWRRLERLTSVRAPDEMLLFPAMESWANDRTADAERALRETRAERGEGDVLPIRAGLYLAALAVYDGRFDSALVAAREAAADARAREAPWLEAYSRWQQAAILDVAGDQAESDALLAQLAEDRSAVGYGPKALLLVARARTGDSEARRFGVLIAPRLANRRAAGAFEDLVAGEASMAAGNYRDAVAALEDAVAVAPELGFDGPPSWYRPAMAYQALAVAYERDGRAGDALATWRHLAERPVQAIFSGSVVDIAAHVRALYHVGRMAESAGDNVAALAATEAFLRRWGGADVTEADEARARMARLGAGP